jgi:hypothetical protein
MKIEIEGDSDAAVAFALLQMIAKGEDKEEGASRQWVLTTFRECMAAVRDDMFTLEIDEDDDEDGDDEDEEEGDEDEEEGDEEAEEPAPAPEAEAPAEPVAEKTA